MFKKITGSIIRTVAAVVAGYAMADMDIGALESTLETVEYWLNINKELVGLITALTVQGWSILEKNKNKKKEVKNETRNYNQ